MPVISNLGRLRSFTAALLRPFRASDATHDRPQVLVVGPAPGQAGGISSVMSYLQAECSRENTHDVRFIDTMKEGRWSISKFTGTVILTVALVARARIKKQPTVVHLNVSTGGSTYRKWFISLLCRLSSTPYIIHLHGGRYRSYFSNASHRVQQMVLSLFRAASKVIVLGTVWRDYLVDEDVVEQTKVVIVPNGTPTPVSLPRHINDDNCVRIMYSGRLSTEKGIADLLEATDLLYDTVKNFELVLMGDSRDPSLLSEAKSRPYCNVTGWLMHDQVVQNLRRGDIFVLPSHDEGLPMSMIEAMSLGLPVLVTDVGAISDVIADGEEGFVVQPRDVPGISAALKSLVLDAALRERMGIQALRRWQSELGSERMTRQIERQWNEALHLAGSSERRTR